MVYNDANVNALNVHVLSDLLYNNLCNLITLT